MRKIKIFDTTLRDGEQAIGVSLSPPEKLKIAKQLEDPRMYNLLEELHTLSSVGYLTKVNNKG